MTVSGKVTPARGGVAVTLTRDATKDADQHADQAADGSFSARVAIGETTRPARRRRGHRLERADRHRHSKGQDQGPQRKDGVGRRHRHRRPEAARPGAVAAEQRHHARRPREHAHNGTFRFVSSIPSAAATRPSSSRRRPRRAGHLEHRSHQMKLSVPRGSASWPARRARRRVRPPGRVTPSRSSTRAAKVHHLRRPAMPAASRRPTQYAVGQRRLGAQLHRGNGIAPGAGRGIINYRLMPSAWRGTDERRLPRDLLAYAAPRRPTCRRTRPASAPWDTAANILAWQEDPFFNYIPWQKTSACSATSRRLDPAREVADRRRPRGAEHRDEFRSVHRAGGVYYAADTRRASPRAQTPCETPLQSQITSCRPASAR